MGKLYTLDDKLLIGGPEIRIGDKLYPVDDRKKTVDKIIEANDDSEVLKLAFGAKAYKEIDDMNMPYPAYAKLVKLVVAAVIGEEEEDIESRFQEAKQQQ